MNLSIIEYLFEIHTTLKVLKAKHDNPGSLKLYAYMWGISSFWNWFFFSFFFFSLRNINVFFHIGSYIWTICMLSPYDQRKSSVASLVSTKLNLSEVPKIPLVVYDYSNKMNFWSRVWEEFKETFSSWRVDRVTSALVLMLF